MSVEPETNKARRGPPKLLVPLVLVVGVLVGILLSYSVPVPYGFGPNGSGPFGPFGPTDQFRNLLILHIVLSTVSIALLVAIIAVYLRIYADTGARFALGILVVMLALLIQSFFQYPLLLGFVGRIANEFGPYLTISDIFTIGAYTVLLYLSLE